MPRLLNRHELLGLYYTIPTTSTYEDRLVAYGNAVQSWLSSPESDDPRSPLSSLCLPQRIYGALRRAGYVYADELSSLTDKQLLCIKDFGPGSLATLRRALSCVAA